MWTIGVYVNQNKFHGKIVHFYSKKFFIKNPRKLHNSLEWKGLKQCHFYFFACFYDEVLPKEFIILRAGNITCLNLNKIDNKIDNWQYRKQSTPDTSQNLTIDVYKDVKSLRALNWLPILQWRIVWAGFLNWPNTIIYTDFYFS